jgi:excinuclease UvrABC ATPase subunit
MIFRQLAKTMNFETPIRLRGVKQNNLRNLDLEIPRKRLTVITGLSGSGKSTLAFETLYAEGQRRYIESLSTYTRQFLEKMPKPELDSIENIPPAVALEQRNTVLNSRSTVGTQTELLDFLRLFFTKAGTLVCRECSAQVVDITPVQLSKEILRRGVGKKFALCSPLEFSSDSRSKSGSFMESYFLDPVRARVPAGFLEQDRHLAAPRRTGGERSDSGGSRQRRAPPAHGSLRLHWIHLRERN